MHTLRSIIFFFYFFDFIGRKVYFLANSFINVSYTVSLTLIWSQMIEGRHSLELLVYRLVVVFFSGKALDSIRHPLSALLLGSIKRRYRCTLLLALL